MSHLYNTNKQATVTISIIKVKLMTLLQAACEEIYIEWMLEELEVNLNQDNNMIIQCDNQQMLCLIQVKIEKLSIKLKHVDIQNHWLCQEYQWDYITVCYVESKSMIANSLTKALLLDSHCWFLDQMNLIDIQDHLQDCWINEVITMFELLKLMNIDWILCELSVSEFHKKF